MIFDESDIVYLQKRDDRPDITNPGMATLFGGAVEAGENYDQALARELHEELSLGANTEDVRFLGWIDKLEEYSSITRCAVYRALIRGVANSEVLEGQGFVSGRIKHLLNEPTLSVVAFAAVEKVFSDQNESS